MDIKSFQNGNNGKNSLYKGKTLYLPVLRDKITDFKLLDKNSIFTIIDSMETYIGTTKIKKEKFGIKGIYSQKQVHNTSGKQNKL